MDQSKKKRVKRYICFGCAAAIAAGLAVMPLAAAGQAESSGPVAVVKSGVAEMGSVTPVLRGGGTLSEQTAQAVTIPAGVKLTAFLAENGDTVEAGQPLASVDKVSVMSAITQVQETLEYLNEQLEAVGTDSGTTKVCAQTGGRVKTLYAQPGDNVQDVILAHGALAVVSLDGRMAVDISSDADLTAGDSVTVTLESGEEVTGRVESTLGETRIITISDEGYDVDTSVRVSTREGDYLGYGKLYVYNAWNATAYYGTVASVNVQENAAVSAGQTLLTLENTDQSAEFEILLKQRQEYEDVMAELFAMYQSGTVSAPCGGTVSGVEEACLLRSDAREYTIQLLANAPTDTPDAVYENTLVWIQSVNDDGSWNVKTAPGPAIEDYLNFSISFDTSAMTEVGSMQAVSVFAKAADGDSVYWTAGAGGNPGDVLLVAGSAFAIRVGYVEIPADVPSQEETEPQPPEASDPTQLPENAEPSLPEGEETQEIPSGGMRGSAMGGMSGYGGAAAQTPVFELFDLTQTTILTVTPGETMTLDITVDELDIGSIDLGQEAEVAVAALNGNTVTGTVTEIGSAVNSGGSSKFTVTITLPKEENMLSGMSAQASLALDTVENILTVPAAALLDDGSVSYVCTGKDEKTGEPNERAAVTTGVSDGETVQILSGLEAGDSYYYSYYDAQDME